VRVVAVEEDERSPQRHGIERIDPVPAAMMTRPLSSAMSRSTVIVGSKRQLRSCRCEGDPATGSGRLTRAIVRRFSSSLRRAVSPVFSSCVSLAWIC
jgi:hypothetical protein